MYYIGIGLSVLLIKGVGTLAIYLMCQRRAVIID